jgi:hypothetical protein
MAKYAHSQKIGVRNSRANPHVIYVEPWAGDYTLLPGEEVVVLALSNTGIPWFNLVESEGATQIYCEETDDFKVLQGGRQLNCGHNRQQD